ncbi:hypothetical protein BDP67DRAFT_57556 [Colletotrichum lupini]|nr:hypothetical protein BDP67DRAFT_57556 [Colletotrichum lupini]
MKNSAKSFRGFGCRFFTMGAGRRCYGGLWRRVVRVGDERIGGGGRWSVDGEFGWGTRGRNGVRKRMAAGCYLLRQTFHRRQGGLWAWLLFQAVSSKVSTLGHSGGPLAQHSPTAGKQFNQVHKIIQFGCHYYSTHNASIFTNFHLIPVLHPSLLPRARLFSTATQPESPLFRFKRRFQAHAFRIVPRNAGCHPSLPPPEGIVHLPMQHSRVTDAGLSNLPVTVGHLD